MDAEHPGVSACSSLGPLWEIFFASWQRAILTVDVSRQRGSDCLAQKAKTAPNVLSFDPELVCDGRARARPVNDVLTQIVPTFAAHAARILRGCSLRGGASIIA